MDTKFLTTRTSPVQQMAGYKTKYNNSATTVSVLWRNAGQSAFQLQENMLKSDKYDVSGTQATNFLNV